MIIIKNIKISKKANFIIVCKFMQNYFLYHLDNLDTKNKQTDLGVWKIKYKK